MTRLSTVTKPSHALSLFDILSRLSFIQAAKLLGPDGRRLITEGGKHEIDVATQVDFDRERFRLKVDSAIVTLSLSPAARDRLEWRCSACETPCEHAGAALSLILEEKLSLGLSGAPPEREPLESLSEETLVAQAIAEREERARTEKMRLASQDPDEIWTDYTITNAASGKTYRVALRGSKPGESYCSCPDFRKNTLGTCKHILHALEKVRRRFPESARNRPYRRQHLAVHLVYGKEIELRLLLPERLDERAARHRTPDPRQTRHRPHGSAATDTPTPGPWPRCRRSIRTRRNTFRPGCCRSASPQRSPTSGATPKRIRCAERC